MERALCAVEGGAISVCVCECGVRVCVTASLSLSLVSSPRPSAATSAKCVVASCFSVCITFIISPGEMSF